MIPLPSQEFFESLLKKNPSKPHEPIVIVLFSAEGWCKPCQRLDKQMLLGLSDKIKWYKCDIDENDYTPGFAGIRSVPTFLAIVNGQPQPLFTCSDTLKVAQWIKSGFKQTS